MRKIFAAAILFLSFSYSIFSQTDTVARLRKNTYMVPMRDGVKLFTAVLSPVNYSKPVPIILMRTPYGADFPLGEDSTMPVNNMGTYFGSLAKSGYIMVLQDIRGKFKSEGTFEMNRQLYHLTDKSKVDESTDTYDAVDWLIKNVKNNNGRAGIFGISYPGSMALHGAVDPHPALKASSPQAPMVDMFLGDDFHHNGAFRLSYAFEYAYLVENAKEHNSEFPFPQFDVYDWYLKLGPLKNVNQKYYKNRLAAWNDFEKHPNYDSFWLRHSSLRNITKPQIPMLMVGGYYDQEDLNGPQEMYSVLEKSDKRNFNYIVLGPWNHGQWASSRADSLGKIAYESKTALWFQELQKRWFDFWLKDIGDGKFAEANCFQTGSNQWKSYDSWPPKSATIKKFYIKADGTAGFEKPSGATESAKYVSDPAKPIPYRNRPIEATYGFDSHWGSWHVEDQRFASSRPDVLTFSADTLKEDLTVTGKVVAHLIASTTGTDADFIVKLIDQYPDIDTSNKTMSGYQLPVAMEVFRGRFRKNFSKPTPFSPGKPEEITIDLHDINHKFRRGHRLVIQIQSTWFPIIDRNPQKYVQNIFDAKETDFIKATHTIYCNRNMATYLDLPVMKE